MIEMEKIVAILTIAKMRQMGWSFNLFSIIVSGADYSFKLKSMFT